MIVKASKDTPTLSHVGSNSYLKIKWPGGIIISKLKAKDIYKVINHNEDIIGHINNISILIWTLPLGRNVLIISGKVLLIQKIIFLNGCLFLTSFLLEALSLILIIAAFAESQKREDIFYLIAALLKRFG